MKNVGGGVFDVELGGGDDFAGEGRGIDIDDGEFLNAFELEARGAAGVEVGLRADGGDPGVAGDFDARGGWGGEERGMNRRDAEDAEKEKENEAG